jgi:hypothetical protein
MPAFPPSPGSARRRQPWALLLLLLGTVLHPAAGQAQMLLDATGAAAMQGTVNSTTVPGATGTLNMVRDKTSAVQSVEGGGASTAPPAASAAPPAAPGGAAPPSGGAPAPARSTARVNGRSVPICSHGGLCHGALLRAMGIR